MQNKTIFEFDDYKEGMAAFLSGKENRGKLSRAADSLKCQRSFLSRVILDSVHLTPEHAYNLSGFLHFSEAEALYFVALVERDRSATPTYRKYWSQKIADLKRQHESIEERISRKSHVIKTTDMDYFSSWIWTAIHFATAIPTTQTIRLIAERLSLKEDLVKRVLQGLEARGFVEKKGEKWRYKSGEFHATADSPTLLLHHQNWRTQSMLDYQSNPAKSVHFTGVLTLSKKDAAKIKSMALDFIAAANKIVGPSDPEECTVLLCDYFSI